MNNEEEKRIQGIQNKYKNFDLENSEEKSSQNKNISYEEFKKGQKQKEIKNEHDKQKKVKFDIGPAILIIILSLFIVGISSAYYLGVFDNIPIEQEKKPSTIRQKLSENIGNIDIKLSRKKEGDVVAKKQSFWPNGNLKEEYYIDDLENKVGESVNYGPSGDILFKNFYKNGERIKHEKYINSKLFSTTTIHYNGSCKVIEERKDDGFLLVFKKYNGKGPDGLWKRWIADRNMYIISKWDDGKMIWEKEEY